MSPPEALEVVLPAISASVPEVRALARRFAVGHGADADALRSVLLASTEAAANSVLHGFVDRAPGTIRIELGAGPDEIRVVIADDGRGMQPRPDSPGLGLGLPTIAQLATRVDIHSTDGEGTEIHMRFAAPGVKGPVATGPVDEGRRGVILAEVSRLAAAVGWPSHGVSRLVDLLVPEVAEVCAVDLIGAGGERRRLAAKVAGDPALSEWLATRQEGRLHASSPAVTALRERRPAVVQLSDDLGPTSAPQAQDLTDLERLPVRWWAAVPLVEEGRPLGVLQVGLGQDHGRPGPEELAFLEDVAARTASGLAHTQLIADLRRTRRRFERILDALGEAVTVHDSRGEMVYANDAAVRLLGASSVDELLRAPHGTLAARFDITREDGSRISVDDFPGQRLARGEPAEPLLSRSVHRESGRERWLLTKATMIDDDELLVINVIDDVTESVAARRRDPGAGAVDA
jgi:PAS domain S-box-containing protein